MGQGFYRDVTDVLKAAGFVYYMPAKGSHEKWRHPETLRVVVVPRTVKSRHTVNAILKQANLNTKL